MALLNMGPRVKYGNRLFGCGMSSSPPLIHTHTFPSSSSFMYVIKAVTFAVDDFI